MLARWCNEINCINLAFNQLERLAKHILPEKKGRGRKPKREVIKYAKLIALKEFDKRTLRGAEAHLSKLVCNERIDHSVIAYWENKKEMRDLIAWFIGVAGAMLDRALSTLFTMVDSTKFTSWKIEEVEFTLCNRIAQGTVYPIGISFETKDVKTPVGEATPEGTGNLYADAWYDANDALGVMFQKGYTPIVCPNKNRLRGHWRRKARKLYRQRKNRLGYRQRGRGESPFGSLTNCYGDRLHARKKTVMQTRSAARTLSYQIKILIRTQKGFLLIIIRHAREKLRFI